MYLLILAGLLLEALVLLLVHADTDAVTGVVDGLRSGELPSLQLAAYAASCAKGFAIAYAAAIGLTALFVPARDFQATVRTGYEGISWPRRWPLLGLNLVAFIALALALWSLRMPAAPTAEPMSASTAAPWLAPFAWGLLLYADIDLVFPFRTLVRLLRASRAAQLCGLAILAYVCLPGLEERATAALSGLLLGPTVAVALLFTRLLGIDAVALPSAEAGVPHVLAGPLDVLIYPPCSGYEGALLLVVILGAYIYSQRHRLQVGRALLLLPAAAVAMFVLNALRIALLFAIASRWSADAAMAGFHSVAGWLNLFLVLGVSIAAINQRFFRKPGNAMASAPGQGYEPRDVIYLLPLVVLLGTGFLTRAVSPGFDWPYPVRVLAAAAAVYLVRARLAGLSVRPSGVALLAGAGVFLLWLALIPPDLPTSAQRLGQLSSAPAYLATAWVALRLAGAVLIVPVAEELAFRRFALQEMMRWLAPRLPATAGVVIALLLSAVLFGISHANAVPAFLAGIAYGLVYLRRRQVADAIWAHAITNLLLGVYVLVTGQLAYW